MSVKRKLIWSATLGVLVGLGVFLFSAYSTADKFIEAERGQKVDVVSTLRSLKPIQKKIVVLYKRHCKVCKAWDSQVVSSLDVYGYDVSYLDIEGSMPEEVNLLLSGVSEELHTPLVLVVTRGQSGYEVLYHITVNSQSALDSLLNYLKSSVD